MSNLSTWESIGVVTQFGVTVAITVALGFLLGSWIDRTLGTGILFSLILAVGGMVSAVMSTLQLLKFVSRRAAARRGHGQE
jgi:F0F1-type ATP synthase assembly protein I